jgi:AmpE protein
MEFVVFLAVYVVRRKLDQAGRLAGDVLWRKGFAHAHRVSPGREDRLGRGLIIIAVPTLILGVGEILLRSSGWSLVIHPVAFMLLLGLTGCPGLGDILDEYTDAWHRGDMQAAWHKVKDLLPPAERGAAVTPEHMHRALSETLIGLIFERYFVIAFWYVIGGIGGAFAAGAFIALRDHWPHAAARSGFGRIAGWINFLPVRLLALTFGVAGDLAGWLKSGKSAVVSLSPDNKSTLMAAASSSLTGYELEPERFSKLSPEQWPDFGSRSLTGIRGLMNRSMLVWICGLALLVIAGVV